jgi:hypothetical protein
MLTLMDCDKGKVERNHFAPSGGRAGRGWEVNTRDDSGDTGGPWWGKEGGPKSRAAPWGGGWGGPAGEKKLGSVVGDAAVTTHKEERVAAEAQRGWSEGSARG